MNIRVGYGSLSAFFFLIEIVCSTRWDLCSMNVQFCVTRCRSFFFSLHSLASPKLFDRFYPFILCYVELSMCFCNALRFTRFHRMCICGFFCCSLVVFIALFVLCFDNLLLLFLSPSTSLKTMYVPHFSGSIYAIDCRQHKHTKILNFLFFFSPFLSVFVSGLSN